MRFTFAQLEAFAAIVQTGSFRSAARMLHVTQPTVSQRIRELESALDVVLFLRNGPRVEMTAEGRGLVDYSRRLIGTASELSGYFSKRTPLAGVLRMGVPATFAMPCMTALLKRLNERWPLLKTVVRIDDSDTMSGLLENAELDVCILVAPPLGSRFHHESLGITELAWIVASRAQAARLNCPADFVDQHVILPPLPSRLHVRVMEWFALHGVTPSRVSTCNNIEVVIKTVESGLAVTVMPVSLVQDRLAQGVLRRVQTSPPLSQHPVSICYQTGQLGDGVKQVMAMMRELIDEHKLYDTSIAPKPPDPTLPRPPAAMGRGHKPSARQTNHRAS